MIGITLYMWKLHEFENNLTSNDVSNIKYAIGKGFGYQERVYSMRVNDYVCRRRTNRPHETPNYEPGKSKFEMDYYTTHIF